MPRKTCNVEQLRNTVNEMLQNSTCSADTRQGMINVLEQVLHDTGNYNGFQYLGKEATPEGQLPGINTHYAPRPSGGYNLMIGDKLYEDATYESRFENTDRTRVNYF